MKNSNSNYVKNQIYKSEYYNGTGCPFDHKSLHSHFFDEISLIKQGEITYISDTVSDKINGMALIYSKAFHLHNPYISPDKTYERYQISVNLRALLKHNPELCSINVPSFILKLSEDEYDELYHWFNVISLIEQSEHKNSLQTQIFTISALYFRIDDIFKHSRHSQIKISNTYIAEVMDYIEKNYATKLKAENIASNFFVSVSKLSCDFKKVTGITLNEYIILARIKKAKEYLTKGMSISYTAEKCGFSSSGYFIKTFQKYNKITPLKYQHNIL